MSAHAPDFPALLQAFFTDRLLQQRRASPHTVAAYCNTFRLLLRFAAVRLGRPPSRLGLADLDAAFLGEFLDHLERERGNSARSRNARLAALHAFFRYVAFTDPAHALLCQRILAIPSKRFERGIVEFLTEQEVTALLDAPDAATWIGRRDLALLLVAVQTGLRVSELTALRRQDVTCGTGAHVRCHGKGRRLRCTPLRRDVAKVLEAWLRECPLDPDTPVCPSSGGGRLSEDAVERLVAKHVATARERCPSLEAKRVTPHTLRHTAAMQLLQHGVDRSVIALWLGHESIETTQIYLHADLRLKEKALARTASSRRAPGRYRPGDALLTFLEGLGQLVVLGDGAVAVPAARGAQVHAYIMRVHPVSSSCLHDVSRMACSYTFRPLAPSDPQFYWRFSPTLASHPQTQVWRGQSGLLLPLLDALRIHLCTMLASDPGPGWPRRLGLPLDDGERQTVEDDPFAAQ